MTSVPHDFPTERSVPMTLERSSYQAYRVLQFVFVVAPILAGLDKFFYLLTDWSQYLAPWVSRMFGGNSRDLMMIAGVVEIIAGIGVALKPKVFGYIVAIWLAGIIINLLSMGRFFDIALRDLGLCLSAIALARLAIHFDVGVWGGLIRRH